MKRLTSLTVGDAARRPHYICGPGVKKDDLLQRLGKCEDALDRIIFALNDNDLSSSSTISAIRDALFTLDQQIQKERLKNG